MPVVVDCRPDTWYLDLNLLAAKITGRTKAIMVVHIYGLPVDMDPVIELARQHDLFIIEDAAEQHGQTYKGRPVGSLGDIAIVSFYPNKQITTGEGGMLLTNDKALADRCRDLRNLCFDQERRYIHEELGWNFRMSNVQAAIGMAQLERIDQIVAKKRRIGHWYQDVFGTSWLLLPVTNEVRRERLLGIWYRSRRRSRL